MASLVIHAEVTCHLLHELVYLLIGPHKREDQKLIYISRVSLDTFPKSALPQLMERASPERRDRARRYVRIDDCLRCLIADGKIQRLSYVPGIIRGHGPPDFARPSQAAEVVKRITDMSSPFGTRFEVGEEDVAVVL